MLPEFTTDFLMKLQMVKDAIPEDGTKKEKKLALDRISAKMDQMPKEYHVTLKSFWQKSLIEALCKQHGLRTYRYPRQKNTTIMIGLASFTWIRYCGRNTSNIRNYSKTISTMVLMSS